MTKLTSRDYINDTVENLQEILRQFTVDTSTFCSELFALKTCMEHIVALIFKQRTFGISILYETRVLCDNKIKVNSSYLLESKLHKKHRYIYFHTVQWAVAVGTMVVGLIQTSLNISDAFTKTLSAIHREIIWRFDILILMCLLNFTNRGDQTNMSARIWIPYGAVCARTTISIDDRIQSLRKEQMIE